MLRRRGLLTGDVEAGLDLAKDSMKDVLRDTGNPKLEEHIYPVVHMTVEYFGENCTTDLVLIALLHDVLEDSGVAEAQLLAQFPRRVVEGVRSLTKEKVEGMTEEEAWEIVHESYFSALRAAPQGVQTIKIIDRINNLHWSHTFSREEQEIYLKETEGFYLPLASSIDPKLEEQAAALLDLLRRRMRQ